MAADSGIGTYIRNLVPRLAQRRPGWDFTALGRVDRLESLGWSSIPNLRFEHADARIYTVAEQIQLARRIIRLGTPDIFWSPHYNIPLAVRAPLVVTVHDVAHLAMPELLRSPVKRGYARAMFSAVSRRASAIICDSDFTRREFARLVRGGRHEETTLGSPVQPRVVHLGLDPVWFQKPAGPRPHARPYVLYTGNLKPHKNVGTLIEAFKLIAGVVPHDLVIVGRGEGLRTRDETLHELARPLGSRIRFAGEVAFDELRRFMAHADLFATASLYEGFGLPPLEAMASGCPCLVSTAGSLPEVCGAAADYADPHDAMKFGAAMRTLLTETARSARLGELGRQHAATFDWGRCAEQTLAIFGGVLGDRAMEAPSTPAPQRGDSATERAHS